MSEIWTGLLGSFVGACGIVGAQLFTEKVTSRREANRLAFEREKFEHEILERRADSLREKKLDTYSRYLAFSCDHATAYPLLAAAQDNTQFDKWIETIGFYNSGPQTEIRALISYISIISNNEINQAIADADSCLNEVLRLKVESPESDRDSVILAAKDARLAHMKLRELMRQELIGNY